MKKTKTAFTLAEVLLTMTVVGVIATMTIPTLHYNRIKKEYTAKLKNFYSRMNNAVLDMQMEKGSFRNMIKPASAGDAYTWYLNNIDPYMGHQYVNSAKRTIYYKDGTSLFISHVGGCLDVNYDVNADKVPNRMGYDQFRFLYCFDDANRRGWFGSEELFFGTYGSGINSNAVSRESMVQKCASADGSSWCTRLLQNDQWEFKGDYPFKF